MSLYYNLDQGLMKGQEAALLNEIILAFSNGSALGQKDSEELKTGRLLLSVLLSGCKQGEG